MIFPILNDRIFCELSSFFKGGVDNEVNIRKYGRSNFQSIL